MKKINITSMIFVILGTLILLLDGTFGISSIFSTTDAGYIAMFIGYPLIIIGIVIWLIGLFVKTR